MRGTPINTQPQPRGRPGPESISGPVLILNENGSKGGTREPVNIPLPDLITSDNTQDTSDPRILQLEDPVESLRSSRFREFVDSQPDPIKQHFIVKRNTENQNSELPNDLTKEDTTTEDPKEDETTTIMFADSSVDCSWNIKVYFKFGRTLYFYFLLKLIYLFNNNNLCINGRNTP